MNYQGKLVGHEKRRVAIVASRFNLLVVQNLVDGAKRAFQMHGLVPDNLDIVWVPGALEIPLAVKKVALSHRYDGIVTLGAVIKGETSHYDLVINQTAAGISHVGMETGLPITFGVLTTNTLEEAQQRSGAKSGNEGYDVALSLLEMIDVFKEFEN